MTTETTVSYHRDGYGPARPAVNVKVYTSSMAMMPSGWGRLPFHADGCQEVGRTTAGDLIDAAYNITQDRFWSDAADKAEALGLGPIEQEGRSGGWLVLTDGRDPQDMVVACDSTVESIRYEAQSERATWLAAYRELSDWCAGEVASAPERVAALAQQLAMDELGAEPARRMWATHRRERTLREARESGDMHPYYVGVQL